MVGAGVEADATLAGTARAVVLDAVAGEDLDPAVVHPDRDLHLHLAERGGEDTAHVGFEVDQVGGTVELTLGDRLPRHRRAGGSGHASLQVGG